MEKGFEVKIYFSGFCTFEVSATDQVDAILRARKLPINNNELITNLENWEEADTANEL